MKWFTAFVVGTAMAIIGIMIAKDTYQWLRQARSATGTVIELVPRENRNNRDHAVNTTYAPRIRYTAQDGTQHELLSSIASSPPAYVVGQTVRVAYHEGSYEGRILTFGECFGFAVGLTIIGTGCAVLSAIFLIGQQIVPRVYLERASAMAIRSESS